MNEFVRTEKKIVRLRIEKRLIKFYTQMALTEQYEHIPGVPGQDITRVCVCVNK